MNQPKNVAVLESPAAVARRGADLLVSAMSAAIEKNGRASLVLSGGSTPQALYELLAAPEYSARVAWEKVLVFFGDERCVPPRHADSNFRMADDALLSKVPVPAENVFRMKGEIDPQTAAREYEKQIIETLGRAPHFDLVLLGLGADGHTASLFPGSAALAETEKLAAANFVAMFNAYRITLTLPALNSARTLIFMVTGAGKSEALAGILPGTDRGQSGPDYPAQLIIPQNGTLLWLLDRAAAGDLQI